jgi:hypothetical protein
MQRRHLLLAGSTAVLALPRLASAQALEKPKTTIAVGGKNLLYYLPLTIAEQRGYFKAEGLDITIVDFAGGARALQAVVGGSADVVSGAFEHTVNMQHKGQRMRAFALQGRAPQIVLGTEPQDDGRLQGAGRPEGQEDRRHRAGLVDQRDGQLLPRQGRAEAQRRVDHRRGRLARCGGGHAVGPDRRDEQPRPGDHAAAAQRRPEDHLRHPHRGRVRKGLRRPDAGGLPVRAAEPSSTRTRTRCRR